MLEQTNNRQQRKEPVRIRPPDSVEADSFSNAQMTELPRWLSVDQVRKLQRMRRETVHAAMRNGELPFEKRGRICYIRLTDVLAWEERRVKQEVEPVRCIIHPALRGLL
jgi:hypothetical protein